MILLPLEMRYKIPYQLRRAKGVFLLLASAVALLLTGYFIGSRSPTTPNKLVTAETARWEWVYRKLRADKRWSLIHLKVPAGALRYQRIPSGVLPEESINPRGHHLPVVAVPRNLEQYLQKTGVTYLDPRALPGAYFKGMSERMREVHVENYLWVPDVSRRQSRFFKQ